METPLEQLLINCHKQTLIAHLNAHPEQFEEAMALALSDKQPYAWRAAWLLWGCMEENDPRFRGYIKKMISALPFKNDNQKRDLLLILLKMELDEGDEGLLFETCVPVWQDVSKKPAVRRIALTALLKIAQKYPELVQEIRELTTEEYLEPLPAATRRAVVKMVTHLV